MPSFRNGDLSLAFDVCGCPNRCRHCWLGQASGRGFDVSEAVKAFQEFRSFVIREGMEFGLSKVRYFSTYFREPHYCTDYRANRDVELELNGGVDYAIDYQLLSVWRLAHDPGYAEWARSVGTTKCQIALFGLEATNDWFCRRRGAHRDIIVATLRLIGCGIQPRWMVILNKKGLPELRGILDLVEELDLGGRVAGMGGGFELFLNDPTPIGEAELMQEFRLTSEDIGLVPAQLIAATERYTGKPFEMKTESAWVEEILSRPEGPIGLDYPGELWFFVTSDWSVYPNIGSLEPWWRLGNLLEDGPAAILSSFVNDIPIGLRTGKELSLHHAAQAFGQPESHKLYMSKTDLCQLWIEQHSRAGWTEHREKERTWA